MAFGASRIIRVANFCKLKLRSGCNFSAFPYIVVLVCTLLNYRVLGTSTAAFFLSNDHSLYAPIYLGWMSCLISFVLHQSARQECVESEKMQDEKVLHTMGLEPTILRSEVWCCTNYRWYQISFLTNKTFLEMLSQLLVLRQSNNFTSNTQYQCPVSPSWSLLPIPKTNKIEPRSFSIIHKTVH